jgi:hypothetical protein
MRDYSLHCIIIHHRERVSTLTVRIWGLRVAGDTNSSRPALALEMLAMKSKSLKAIQAGALQFHREVGFGM